MAKKQWIKRDYAADYRRFVAQKGLIEKFFPCFRCRLSHRTLECIGEILPSVDCATYRVRFRYKQGDVPKVWIEDPPIAPSPRIHRFRDGSLCLYFWREDPWKSSDDIHRKIIPWIAEWLVFYELYLITGKWLGPEAPHGSAPKIEQADVR
jgi:hypothetical protein